MRKLFTLTVLMVMGWSLQAQVVNTFPYVQDFESLSSVGNFPPCALAAPLTSTGWINDTNDDQDWLPYAGQTGSTNTGPTAPNAVDHNPGTAAGIYLYTETSGCTFNDAFLVSPYFDFSNMTAPKVEFWYHMFGATMGTMHFDIDTTGYGDWKLDIVPSWTDNLNSWQLQDISLVDLAGMDSARFRIRGMTGSSFTSDMAVDDFKVFEPQPYDLQVNHLITPMSPACSFTSSETVSFELENVGINAIDLDDISITYNITGPINSTSTDTLTGPGSLAPNTKLTVTFTTAANMSTSGAYTIAYSAGILASSGNTDGNLSNNADTTLVQPGLSGVYTIDTAMATGGSNYRNFTDATEALRTFGICGPVTFNVVANSGPYNEQVWLDSISGSSVTNTITFDGGATKETLFFNNTNPTDRYVFQLRGAKYVTLRNLTITSNASQNAIGIHLKDRAEFNTIDNCVVLMDPNATSGNVGGIIGAQATSTFGLTGTGDAANNTTVINTTVDGGYYGIMFYGLSSTIFNSNNRIDSSDVTNSTYGIYLYYQESPSVVATNVALADVNTFSYGIYTFYTDILNLIGNNISNFKSWGVYVSYTNFRAGPGVSQSRLVNNMVAGSPTSTAFSSYGIYVASRMNDLSVWHNSVSMPDGGSSLNNRDPLYVNLFSTNSGLDVRNNSFANFLTGSSNYAAWFDNDGLIALDTLDFNNYYTVDTAAVLYMGVTPVGVGGMNAVGGPSSLYGDPVYIDNVFDLHSKFTQLNDVGDNSVGVGIDIDGDNRPAMPLGIVDMGADEYTPPQNDAALTDLLKPILPICSGNTDVEVMLRNAGLDTINSVTIRWTINGVMQPDTNLTGLALLTGDTMSVNLGSFNVLANQTYDLVIYSMDPNGVMDEDNANDTLKFIGLRTGLVAGTYTIDSGTPTGGTNYQSFADAVADLNTFGVCGPVVFNVEAGSGPYNEVVTMGEIQGASIVNTITFNGGATKEMVFTSTSASLVNRGVFNLLGSDYVTLRNLTIANYDTVVAAGVLLRDRADFCTVDSCDIVIDTTLRQTSFGLAGIVASSPTSQFSSVGVSESANNLTLTYNHITGGTYGIVMYYNGLNNPFAASNIARFNTMDSIYYYGMFSYYQDAPLITNNEINLRTQSTFGYGMYIYANDAFKVIANNIVNPLYTGIYVIYGNYQGGTPVSRGQLINNMISGEYVNTTPRGIYINFNSLNIDVFHNSVAMTSGAGRALETSSTNISGLDIRNNSFATFSGGGWAVDLQDAGNVSTFDYNNFYNNNSQDLIIVGTTTYDTSNYQGGGGFNGASISGDPGYVDNFSDLHAGKSGLLWDRGNNAAGVADDIDGDIRPGFSTFIVDIGADEFEPPAIQGTLAGIASPTSGCGLTDSTDVIVSFRNSGTDTLNSVSFTYRVNGGTPVTETVSGTYPPNTGFNFTFNQTANMQTVGTYTLDAWIVVVGDTCQFDDSVLNVQVVNVPTITSYPYVEDFENGNGGWTAEGNAEWELGMPTGAVIDTAASGVNAWVTDLDDIYEPNACGYVISPCFDFSNLGLPEVSVSVWWNSEFSWDGAVLQSTIDNGATWQNVGAVGDPNNWFNDNSIYGLGPFACASGNNEDGWGGRNISGNGSGDWVTATREVPSLAGEPGVRFRFYFGSDGSIQDDGFGFDDFAVRDLPPTDVGVTKLLSPRFGDCGDSSMVVEVEIANYGSQSQTNIPITVQVDTGGIAFATLNTTYTDTLQVKALDTVVVGTINTYAGGFFDFTMWTSQTGDADASNDTTQIDSLPISEVPAEPAIVNGNTQVLCIPDSMLLSVVQDTNFAYNWFASDTSTSAFAEDTFQIMTPFLTNDTTYYVEAVNGGSGGCIRITEAELGGPDYLEITNSGNSAVDVTGWTVAIGEDGTTDINTVATTTQTLTGVMQPGDIIWWDDAFGSGVNYWGTNILWNGSQEGWILILDAQGQVVDYMVWQWSATDVSNFNPTVAGFSVDITGEWTGGGMTSTSFYTNVYRVGNTDNNDATDFTTSGTAQAGVKAQLNPGLTIPFAACGGTGCVSPRTRIDIIVSPPVPVDLGPDQVTCGDVILDPGAGYASYKWNTGDSTQTLTVSTSGTYSLVVENVDGCKGYDTVIVSTNPNPAVDLGPDTVHCGAYLLNAGNPGASHTWQDGSQSQTYLATSTGLYTVNVLNTQTGCFTIDSVNVQVDVVPAVDLGVDRTECDSAVLSSGNPGLPTLWSTGATSEDITVTSSNQYWVEVTDPNNGCVGVDTVNLAVAPSPTVALGADTIICDGDVILLDAGNPGASYLWNTGGMSQTEAVDQMGNYTVVVTDANGCEGTDTISVDVAPPAVADFNVNQVPFSLTFNFFNNSTGYGNLSYAWDFGDTNTSTQTDPSHTYGAMGNYIVTLTVTDDCGTATYRDTITVDEVNAIDDGLLAGAIKLFPNPTDGKVFVVIQDLDEDVDVHITDVTGREIASRMIPRFEQDQAIEFDLSDQAEGVYLIRFEANGTRLLRKVILER